MKTRVSDASSWIGPPMGAPMMASARIMETFAHGQDVRDALGVPPVASHRLRHVAHLGVATRDYAFRQRRLDPPAEPFRVELTYEDETWTWGPAEAAQRVHGPALDFALLATRRRHRQDGNVVAEGPTPTPGSTSSRPSPVDQVRGEPRCRRQREDRAPVWDGSSSAALMHAWHGMQSTHLGGVREGCWPTPDSHHKHRPFFEFMARP